MALEGAVVREEVVRAGTRFGPEDDLIELGEELGSGAAARVYVCRRLRTGEELAAKVINLQRLGLLGDFESQMSKLDREVKILRDLAHPRIVGLHSVQRTKGWVFLVMELVRGGELFDRIVQNKSLNEVEAKHVFRQLLEGVGYMHSRNVIHRDLKPENILIASSRPAEPPAEGFLHEVKIADFGLSKIISKETSWAKTFVGTPQYWAPEVLAVQGGTGIYNQACDFWSLGAVLFVMLCGRYPFDGKKMPLEEQIRTASYNMSTLAWQKVSDEAKSMVRGLLVVNVGERFTLGDCLNHPWLTGSCMAPPRPSSPALSRSVSVKPGLVGGPRVTEVSAGNAASGAVPIVSQPSHISDVSVDTGSGSGDAARRSGSVEHVSSPEERADPSTSRTRVAPFDVDPPQGAGQGCGLPHETIFCLNELLKLQVSIAGSLEIAALAFRHANPELADAIQGTFWECKDLSGAACEVVSKYAQVAQQVSGEVLPDLDLAVQEKEPSLATGLLGMVKEWVVEMKKQGERIKLRYHGLQESVHKLIQRAQKSKMGSDRRLAEAMESLLAASPPQRPPAIRDGAWEDPCEDPAAGACGAGHREEGEGAPPRASPPPAPSAPSAPPPHYPARGAVSFAPKGPAPAPAAVDAGELDSPSALSLSMASNHWTRQLFEQLRRLQMQPNKALQDEVSMDECRSNGESKQSSGSPAGVGDLDTEAWKQEMLELLFMMPGVLPSSSTSSRLPKVESYDGEDRGRAASSRSRPSASDAVDGDVPMRGQTPSTGSSARPGGCSNVSEAGHDEDEAIMYYVPGLGDSQSAAEAMSHSSASLLRALHELKRVDEILEGCAAFWANMDGTVQKLQQMKEHTECLVNFAAKSKPLKDRFEQRLNEYTSFWLSLERLCRQYCVDHQTKTKRMYEVIREVSDAADVIETANSARMGIQLMREKQRRREGGY